MKVTSKTIGLTMTAYYGGRTEVRVRRTIVPVVYTDFLSMYPTVNVHMGLWDLLIAERLEIEDATADVRSLLATLTLDQCFDPRSWRALPFFASVTPRGDILPVRAPYDDTSDGHNIGVNPLTSDTPLWYAGPDLVASTILTGRPPRIVRAFRLVPRGRQKGLRRVALRGSVRVDPKMNDFFRAVIEARKGLDPATLSPEEHRRLDDFLKVVANAGSYGILAELNREPLPTREYADLTAYGLDGAFSCKSTAPEHTGPFWFPPVAALIPPAARFILALLERLISDAGGVHAFCDTDSMAIVANETGGLVPCPGGPHVLPDGRAAIPALSRVQVDEIVARFIPLNPYDRSVVAGSILKVESVNFDPETGARRQLECLAISAKRYALFTREPDGTIRIYDRKEHGLGHLLNPTNPEDPSRDWIDAVWEFLVRDALGEPAIPPAWFGRAAVSREAITVPQRYRQFLTAQAGLPYVDRIKPMNFVLSAHVAPLGHPAGVDPTRFHLIAPYTTDPSAWARSLWTDIYSGKRFPISTAATSDPVVARVASYGDVIARYRTHPEPKSLGPDGIPCSRNTVGLLRRRPVRAAGIVYSGKESNLLDEVERGLVHDWGEVLQTYRDPRRDQWVTTVVPFLKRLPAATLARQAGLTKRTIQALRNGHARPSSKTRWAVITVALEHAQRLLAAPVTEPETKRLAERLCRAWLV